MASEALRVELQRPTGAWVEVGYLSRTGELNTFESLDSYWDAVDRPVLGQIFDERGRDWRPARRLALPTWFSHLLPEGLLRDAIANAVGVNPIREFFLLERIGGDDLPGGVRVTRAAVTDQAAGIDREPEHLDEEYEAGLAPFKFSLAGVQLKFSVRVDDERGLTVPAKGEAGEWIAKLPDFRLGHEGIPEAEFAGLELARAAGLTVPDARLVDVRSIAGLPDWAVDRGGRALLVKRFDRREGGQRVHVEELAQIINVPTGREHAKYLRANFETVGRVTAALAGVRAVEEVVDRIVLNVLLGNGDAHTKNWAYVYADGQTASLSPVYDVVPTVLFVDPDDLGMKLAGSRSFNDVDIASFDRLAAVSGWNPADARDRASGAVARVMQAWPVLQELLPRDRYDALTARRNGLLLATA